MSDDKIAALSALLAAFMMLGAGYFQSVHPRFNDGPNFPWMDWLLGICIGLVVFAMLLVLSVPIPWAVPVAGVGGAVIGYTLFQLEALRQRRKLKKQEPRREAERQARAEADRQEHKRRAREQKLHAEDMERERRRREEEGTD